MMKKHHLLLFFLLFALVFVSCASKKPAPVEAEPEPEIDPVELSLSYLEEGVKLEKENQIVEAYEKYTLALTTNPANDEALKNRDRLLPKMQRLSEIHYSAGMKFLKKGKNESAQREFLQATRLWPENEKAARMLDSEKKSETALSGDYITYTMKPGDSLSKLAQTHYRDSRKYTVIAEFNHITDPASTKAGQIIKIPKIEGVAFREGEESGSDEKPEGEETVAVKLPDDQSASVQPPAGVEGETGTMSPEQKETDQGEISGEGSDSTGSEVASAIEGYRTSGTGYYNQNNFEMAITEFTKIINDNPDDKEAIDYLGKSHYNRAVILFEKKNYMEAKDHFVLAEKYDPSCKNCGEYTNKCDAEYKDMHYKKGVAFYSQQKLEAAIASWRLVEAVDPDYMDVKKHIDKAENLLKRLEEIKKQ